LTSAVAETQDITVFAPTNDAFDALGKKTLDCLQQPVGLPKLADVLKYHVVPSKATAKDLSNDESLPTLDKHNLTVMLDGDTVTIKGGGSSANVTKADIMATNGVVHEVNAVLIPKDFAAPDCGTTGSIADTAVATKELSTLVAALAEAGLVNTFNGTDVFTVFAPTNDAFKTLNGTDGLVSCLLEPKNKDALTKVLTYHVVAGYDLAADITDGLKVQTLESEKLTFVIKDKNVMINTTSDQPSATVVMADVFATNGVVHVIDEVLIPADFKNPCSSEFVADEAIVV
jgi:uncharacterized surface protein with fasciclin (FAS1) repeats